MPPATECSVCTALPAVDHVPSYFKLNMSPSHKGLCFTVPSDPALEVLKASLSLHYPTHHPNSASVSINFTLAISSLEY